MIKRTEKKILSIIFAVCMLVSSFGDPSLYVSAESASRSVVITADSGSKVYDGTPLEVAPSPPTARRTAFPGIRAAWTD